MSDAIDNAVKDSLAGAAQAPEPTESGFSASDLPLFYRTDVINAVLAQAAKVEPDWVHRFIKVGQTTAANPAGKRLKGWRPIEDKTVIAKITSILGDGATMLVANGHIAYNELELWHMEKRQALAIRHFNSLRAHGMPGDVTKSLEAQFADAKDRTGGRVSVEMTPSDVFDRHAGTSIARKGSK